MQLLNNVIDVMFSAKERDPILASQAQQIAIIVDEHAQLFDIKLLKLVLRADSFPEFDGLVLDVIIAQSETSSQFWDSLIDALSDITVIVHDVG